MRVPRVLCVVRPLKITITNYPEGEVEELDAPYYPHDVQKEGSHPLPFSRELYIDRDDFMEDPPKKFFRLAPGREVRLRYGYLITCTDVIKDSSGSVVELRCTYDAATRGGNNPMGARCQGTIHWVSAAHALDCEVRLYDRLFAVPDPMPYRRARNSPPRSTANPWYSLGKRRSSPASLRIRRERGISSSARDTS